MLTAWHIVAAAFTWFGALIFTLTVIGAWRTYRHRNHPEGE